MSLLNKKIGNLLVISETTERKYGNIIWKCICECGNECFLTTKNLKRGKVKSCGCVKINKEYNTTYIGEDLSGRKFGKLSVLNFSHSDKYKNKRWECLCECGNKTFVTTSLLNKGHSKSCGKCRKGKDVYNYSGYKDITGTKWNSIKGNAESRSREFSITKEYVWEVLERQNHLCNLTKLPISFLDKTASVDRIDSSIGYILGNIQIVHKDINRIKSDLDQSYFIKLCKLVSKNYR